MQKLNRNENGRSMLEMLGVLAITGVLSISGIAGYRWAVDKKTANDIWEDVRWISLLIQTDVSMAALKPAGEMPLRENLRSEIAFTLLYKSQEGYVLKVSDASKGALSLFRLFLPRGRIRINAFLQAFQRRHNVVHLIHKINKINFVLIQGSLLQHV